MPFLRSPRPRIGGEGQGAGVVIDVNDVMTNQS